jgi:hypothetical protein
MAEEVRDERGVVIPVVPVQTHPNPLKDKDRITARLVYYHEHHGYAPATAELHYSDFLETFEIEPQTKRMNKVLPVWHPLPIGDLQVEHVGMVVIENLAGRKLSTVPTDEDKARFAKQIIRVRKAGVENGLEIVVKPGRFETIHAPGTPLEIKCDFEEGRGYAWIFPR